MESTVELGLDDLFEEPDLDQDAAIDQGLNDNEADADEGDERDENGDLETQAVRKARDMSKGAAKKVVKNPQPKLDHARLNSDRGFPALRGIFENQVKFKGRGHEMSDFLLMMQTLEHWAHRLFPKMTFDEVIERCERLGVKNQVKTVLRKIRMGMPVLDDEFIDRGDSDVDENEDGGNHHDRQDEFPVDDDELDDLLRDAESDLVSQPITPRSQAPPSSQSPPSSQAPPSQPKSPVFSLNEDQRERMERNKRLAMEKRMKRLKAQGLLDSSDSSSISSQPTSQSRDQSSENGGGTSRDLSSQNGGGLSADSDVSSSLPVKHSVEIMDTEHRDNVTSDTVTGNQGCSQSGENITADEILDEFADDSDDALLMEASESLNLRLESESETLNLKLSECDNNSQLNENESKSESIRENTVAHSQLSPVIVDTVVDKENDVNSLNVEDSETELKWHLDTENISLSQNSAEVNDSSMEVDS